MKLLSLYEDEFVADITDAECDSDCDTESDHACDCHSET